MSTTVYTYAWCCVGKSKNIDTLERFHFVKAFDYDVIYEQHLSNVIAGKVHIMLPHWDFVCSKVLEVS